MDNNQKIDMAIEIANEMKDRNSKLASDLIEQIEESLNISQYNSIDRNVIVMISVRQWTDMLSSWYSSTLCSSKWYIEYDLYKFKLNTEELCNRAIDDLIV